MTITVGGLTAKVQIATRHAKGHEDFLARIRMDHRLFYFLRLPQFSIGHSIAQAIVAKTFQNRQGLLELRLKVCKIFYLRNYIVAIPTEGEGMKNEILIIS